MNSNESAIIMLISSLDEEILKKSKKDMEKVRDEFLEIIRG
jgi:hypothetical protein